MKKIAFVYIGILSLLTFSLYAQDGRDGEDFEKKYHSQKVAYLTTEMDLTPEESAAFWPLYNAHEKEKGIIKDEMKSYRQEVAQKDGDLSEEEALEALKSFQVNMGKMHQIELFYQNKYLEVIPATKVILLLKAEKEFRRDLLRELANKRRHRGGRNTID
ncbi:MULTISPECIES: hypothetical protein [unclassified Lentimicrobium]|uniref:hypothetical protein n=1 Tax=unclassified Lentimicrobium TaxID=2677434 RepID=UPI0015543479|nr:MULTISPECIES: hypothetical protein [unclassified Lentimicrobium]NPD45205.1 hypothetical protein [Lentimicrobium sp. S6]NPD86575.1 hypothetical protein [Lentimicrobium sp. L6]